MAASAKTEKLHDLVDALAARWENEPTHLLIHAFPLLAEGKPAPIGELAERAGLTERAAIEAVRNSRADVDDENNVTSLFGVGLSPSAHRIDTHAATIYACCGLVAQTIAQLAQRNIQIRSADPVSGGTVTLDVSPGGLLAVAPKTTSCIFAHGAREDIINNPYQTFCRHVRYCESEETADRFIQLEPGRFGVDVEECNRAAARLAKQAWSVERSPAKYQRAE
jgi:hypothetical protein